MRPLLRACTTGSLVESKARVPASNTARQDSEGEGSRASLFGRNFLVRITDETTRVVGDAAT